jgi:hypothetical protein
MHKLGQLAGDPVKVGEPLFLIALCLICLTDMPGPPLEQPPGQRWHEISGLVHQQRDHDRGHQEGEHFASHRATRKRSNSVTG